MSEINRFSIQVTDFERAGAIFEGVRSLKPDDVRGFWARALDWLIATQKRRAKSALQRYYDEH